jgi:hypothetical protein
MMQTGQVFVSHTSDMARFPENRSFTQAALDAVVRAGMTPVDMRYFAARDGAPADYCRARVRECQIYVAVIGFRYGSMVPGETVSYTELEFQTASAAGLPRLVFLLENAASLPEGFADGTRSQVEGFRQRLRDAGLIVRGFTSDAGLELEVFHALTELHAAGGGGASTRNGTLEVHGRNRGAAQFPERRRQVVTYLQALINWVNTDPWPRDRRFGGPVLTPAVIERKLRVFAPGRAGEENLDADDLAQQCRRLVVLGGPGSGKTWLARRTVRRCAELSLKALAAGAELDEVELPLYTTCSRLFSVQGDIREAAVSSALNQMGDLGNSKLNAELRTLLAGRNGPAVLVIDSLDEAHGSQERLRQADTLPWRIILTTRPSSWNQQLAINDTDDSHRVGELQPLRYPEDVEPFIRRWFEHQPERGEDLAAQIARRPGLQQAATVPLVLAFYCIVGGREPLPDYRRELYGKVLTRMLTGRWRGDETRQPDVSTCLQALRTWAWPGPEASHPVSGIGTWSDDLLTTPSSLSRTDQEALDHVAMPLGPPDVDTGQTLRRFIHRSIREHLVAENVARLQVREAADVLLPHLWHDPDWEYSVPAAIAMHPHRDRLLRELICRAAQSEQVPADLSVIDAGWDFRGLLARVAAESSEDDWSAENAQMISQVRVELAMSGRLDTLGPAALWGNSNRMVREALLGLLGDPATRWASAKLVGGVVQLATSADDKNQAGDALLGLLPGHDSGYKAARFVATIVGGVTQLATTTDDKRRARDALLRLLDQADGWVADELATGISQLSPTAQDRRQARGALFGLLSRQSDEGETAWLAGRAVRLATTDEDKRETRDKLLRLLTSQADGWLADEMRAWARRLSPVPEENSQTPDILAAPTHRAAEASIADEPAAGVTWRAPAAKDRQLDRDALLESLARETYGRVGAGLAAGLMHADPTEEDKRLTRRILLGLLAGEHDGRTAAELAGIVSRLGPDPEEKRQARRTLVRLLTVEGDSKKAAWLADGIIRTEPSADEKRQVRDALLALLAGSTDGYQAARLASRVYELNPTADDKRRTRKILLRSLADPIGGHLAGQLTQWMCRLDPTTEDKRQTRDILTRVLARQTDSRVAQELAGWMSQLDPTAEDKHQTRVALLGLLHNHADEALAPELLAWVIKLATTPEDKNQTRVALLGLLRNHADEALAPELLAWVIKLATTPEDKNQTRVALLGLLSAAHTGAREAAGLVGAAVQLLATSENKRQTLAVLLRMLTSQTDGWKASELVAGIIQLDPTAQDKSGARNSLLALLTSQTNGPAAAELLDRLVQLDPTTRDIDTWPTWAVPPTGELLGAVRRNSELAAWLQALPTLAHLSSSPL